jgi:hypothetical protein
MTVSTSLAIALTAYNRPDLLSSLLLSLVQAQGVRDWRIHVDVDPSPLLQQNLDVLGRYEASLDIVANVNRRRKGVRRNPFDAVAGAFASGADIVLLLEDDLSVSRDALTVCRALVETALLEPSILCANLLLTTCFSESIFDPVAAGEWSDLAAIFVKTRFFSSYGLLMAREQWERYFVAHWFADKPAMLRFNGKATTGWDTAMNRLLFARPHLNVLQSLVPRVNHHAPGTHVKPEFQRRSFDNVELDRCALKDGDCPIVLDPFDDLGRIPSGQARLYLNLCRHVWTLQEALMAAAGEPVQARNRASGPVLKRIWQVLGGQSR